VNHYRLFLVSLLILGAILTTYGGLYLVPTGQQEKNNAETALSGEIIPFKVDFTQPFDIMLSADVHFLYNVSDLAKGFDLSTLPPFTAMKLVPYQLRIQFDNGKMLVSASIRNSNGTLIAQIVNNEWKTVNPDTLLFWDRNYNAYAVEIIGINNKPTLQVIMVGPNAIQIGGLFFTKTGSVYIAPNTYGADIYVNVGPNQHRENNATFQTIFQYPCLTDPSNLGKMINPIYPSSNPSAQANWDIDVGYVLSALGVIFLAIFGVEMSDTITHLRKRPKAIGERRKADWHRKR
jgi:hypothetical protein